ncbi:hypothetical protein CALCODRAFT_429357 [Calocera cornea HHB12733]|uniref:Family A G protein-coupled receptor-like protein n=1 Tax=Calocera cornea HHB12733 TaxID=1353952 RepID=A0A165IDU6_9BASI|nr:hypothetical protein CALCODRAFT_429357 [Calocera cornea HHB12733]
MSDSLDVTTAALAGVFTSAILYGVFLVLFIACVYVLLRRSNLEQPNYILLVAAIIMFILNTSILALSFSRVLDIFVMGSIIALNLSQWKEVARTTLTSAYMALADALLIYRCWIVWKRRLWVVAVPVVLLAACAGLIIMLLRGIALSTESAEGIFAPSIAPWISSVLAVTLLQNLLVTGLIVWQIYKVNSSASRAGGRTLRPIMAMLIESGGLYSATLFIWLMTYVATSNSEYIMVDCINPMIGITYFLLVIRVRTNGTRTMTSTAERISGAGATQSHPLQAISVEVHRHYHTDPSPGKDSVSDFGAKDVEDQKTSIYFEESQV